MHKIIDHFSYFNIYKQYTKGVQVDTAIVGRKRKVIGFLGCETKL